MMLLIAMAIAVAYAASMATSLEWFDLEFWWELAALITIMLLNTARPPASRAGGRSGSTRQVQVRHGSWSGWRGGRMRSSVSP